MIIRTFVLILLFPSLLFSQVNIDNEIQKLAKSYLKNKPGALIIGVRNAGVNKVYYFGEVKGGSKQLPDNNSLFELGELSEIFTTTLYSELVFDKVISSDDALQKFLPENIKAPEYTSVICEPVDKEVNFSKDAGIHVSPYVCRPDTSFYPQPLILCYLANHTSGLPNYPDNRKQADDPFLNYSDQELFGFLKDYRFINSSDFKFRHSTLGMGILGFAMELKTGKEFNRLLKEKISTPLGITSTLIYKPAEDQKLLQGHNSKGKSVPHMHYGVLGSAIGISSNITDMMKILEANMLTEKSHIADIFAFNQKSRIKSGGKEYALGWRIKNHNAKSMVFNSGKTNGFASWIGLFRDERKGVVILSSVSKDATKLGEGIIDLLIK